MFATQASEARGQAIHFLRDDITILLGPLMAPMMSRPEWDGKIRQLSQSLQAEGGSRNVGQDRISLLLTPPKAMEAQEGPRAKPGCTLYISLKSFGSATSLTANISNSMSSGLRLCALQQNHLSVETDFSAHIDPNPLPSLGCTPQGSVPF